MKCTKFTRRAAAGTLAAALLCASALPALAAGASPLPKEEVIYGKLAADGSVRSVYAVNSFTAAAGQAITDYGDYTAVRNMTTTDPLTNENGTVSLTPAADGSVYYEGTMDPSTPLPWLVDIRYSLDGVEYTAEELAGRSGALTIRIDVGRNPDCTGDWFDRYALQTTLTLDTNHASNIRADGATVASVGADKQIVFTMLPGQPSSVAVSADVTDFAMPAITLNGVRMKLSLDIDGESVSGLFDRLTNGASRLDEGAAALGEGIASLEAGVAALDSRSGTLTGGSSRINDALLQLKSALSGVSASSDQLNALLDASAQIGSGISQLDDGVAQLESQVNYDAYKRILAENGLDLDALAAGNEQALAMLQALSDTLSPFGLSGQVDQIVLLLQGNTANLGAIETYLGTVNSGIATLRQGSAAVKEGYASFDAGIRTLASAMTSMLQNLALLSDAVSTLAAQYAAFDSGVSAYTGGVARLLDGAQQLNAASALLVSGAHELYTQTNSIGLDDQLGSLLETLSGDGETVSFTSPENGDVAALQFALQTDPIEPAENAAAPAQPAKEPTFWEKLLALFGLYGGD